MIKDTKNVSWNGFAASVPGFGHIRHGVPCQDASAVMLGEYPALIVCDGRGSAKLSHFGAQEAVAAFKRQSAILSPFIANVLDDPDAAPEKWDKFCKILFRTLIQAKLDLAESHDCPEKEFDFTVALAIAGKEHVGCFQVGDGALVLWRNGNAEIVFAPDKGEFANQTHFLRPGGEETGSYHAKLFPAAGINGISATSDGPEYLMFQLADMTPGKIFDLLFSDLAADELCRQDLMDYLTRKEWNNDPRGADDRSIAIIARPGTVDTPEQDDTDDAADEIQTAEDIHADEIQTAEDIHADEIQTAEDTENSCPEDEIPEDSSEKNPAAAADSAKRTDVILKICCIVSMAGVLVLGGYSWKGNQMLTEISHELQSEKQGLILCRSQLRMLNERCEQHRKQLKNLKPCDHGAEKFSTAEDQISLDAGAIPAGSTNIDNAETEKMGEHYEY